MSSDRTGTVVVPRQRQQPRRSKTLPLSTMHHRSKRRLTTAAPAGRVKIGVEDSEGERPPGEYFVVRTPVSRHRGNSSKVFSGAAVVYYCSQLQPKLLTVRSTHFQNVGATLHYDVAFLRASTRRGKCVPRYRSVRGA